MKLLSQLAFFTLCQSIQFFISGVAVFGHGGSEIKFLHGFEGPLPFYLETGYVGVDEEENVQLFYYFVKSTRNEEDEVVPFLFWLTGGPGCSVLSSFLFQNGPLSFDLSSKTNWGFPRLKLNPYSWTQEVNILYVDSPVGTGFSYAKTKEATYTTNAKSTQQVYVFLHKWLRDHPEFVSNPFYIGGSSFSGTTVPVIARMIADDNEFRTMIPKINLQGYLLGDPITNHEISNYKIPFAYGIGIIPPDLYKSLKRNCKGNYTIDPSNKLCFDDLNTFNELYDYMDDNNNVMEPKCPSSATRRYISQVYEEQSPWDIKCSKDLHRYSEIWANDPSVRESLRVRNGSKETWIRCNSNIILKDEFSNMISFHKNLTSRGYRSLIYSGNFDPAVPFHSTLAWIDSLNSPVVDKWRPWFVEGRVAGFTRSFANNMTYATVWGAGHITPETKPKESYSMFKRWISHNTL